jgi:NAD(P)-dependent dehydrogenase (short-subunit alcohol dehydrogenase family)
MTKSLFDLTGRKAFVTGGGTGLGYYMARSLVKAGAKVMIAARRENTLQDASLRMNREVGGETVEWCRIDLSDPRDIADKATYAGDKLGGVDILIGNAAQDGFEPFNQVEAERINQLFQINVTANMLLTRYFLPPMQANHWGRIIFSSSIAAKRPSGNENMVVYAATKGALSSFAKAIANEVGRDGINVNSLILGVWQTEMFLDNIAKLDPAVARSITESLEGMTSLGRLGKAEELEGLIQLLASDAGSYITGTESVIDGGMNSMMRPMPSRK